jgi:hypothetical protein
MRDETNAQADTASRATQDHENVEPEATSAAATADTPVGAGGPVGGNAASTASASSNPLDHVLEWIAAAAARGVQSQQVSRGIFDEPLPYRAEVDWIQALDLAMRRGDSERERLERVESKLAPIIAGTVMTFILAARIVEALVVNAQRGAVRPLAAPALATPVSPRGVPAPPP